VAMYEFVRRTQEVLNETLAENEGAVAQAVSRLASHSGGPGSRPARTCGI
jgi:hypothetical protein